MGHDIRRWAVVVSRAFFEKIASCFRPPCRMNSTAAEIGREGNKAEGNEVAHEVSSKHQRSVVYFWCFASKSLASKPRIFSWSFYSKCLNLKSTECFFWSSDLSPAEIPIVDKHHEDLSSRRPKKTCVFSAVRQSGYRRMGKNAQVSHPYIFKPHAHAANSILDFHRPRIGGDNGDVDSLLICGRMTT